MSKIQEDNRRFHIILDAFNCKLEALEDKAKVEEVIREIARLCGMTIAHGPVVIEGVLENPGVTGFAIIDFSHISIHTFTSDLEVCIDIFSCKPFDTDGLIDYVKLQFGLEDQNLKLVHVKYDG